MTAPHVKRFAATYEPVADAIARLDIDQTLRERIAQALTEVFTGRPDFMPDTFRLLASDPLSPCAGYGDFPCPGTREIRTRMHNAHDPQGRSAAWRESKPVVRCVSCGMVNQGLMPAAAWG